MVTQAGRGARRRGRFSIIIRRVRFMARLLLEKLKRHTRHRKILLRNGGPNTKLCIEGVDGKFDLVSIDVYSIGASFFYESFNFMEGKNHQEFSVNDNAEKASCDYNSWSTLNSVTQSERCIYFRNVDESKYIAPKLSTSGEMAILSFKLSRGKQNNPPQFIISCSGDATFSQFNSNNMDILR